MLRGLRKTVTRIVEDVKYYRSCVHSLHFEEDNFARVMSIEYATDGTLHFSISNNSVLGGRSGGLIVLEKEQIDWLMDFLRKCKGDS